MNINRKYIIIFGTLILSLIIIIGGVTYYKQKTEQAQVPDVKQSVLSFSRDYPTNYKEIVDFVGFCKNAVLSDTEELKNNKTKEVVCTIGRESRKIVLKNNTILVDTYIPSISHLDSISSFKINRYIGISVDLEGIIRKYNPTFLEEEKLYFCSVSEPSWIDPLILQSETRQVLVFDKGNIACVETNMNETLIINFTGFIPQAESLNIKYYLVNEQTVSDVMSKQSFSEIKDILEDYPIIWQMEKPIIP